jgi:membrane protease subunit (stomatin/prohibitin family)
MVQAQADAMKTAAGNANGAMMGFMGMNMAQNAGGLNANALYQMAQQAPQTAAPAQDGWKCSCGAENQGNFCPQCGNKKPVPAAGWTCSCGAQCTGNFCSQCGTKRPAAAAKWYCADCGAENTGKFCAQCGKPKA